MKRQDLQMVSLESHSQVHAYISLESSKSLLGPSSVDLVSSLLQRIREDMTLCFRKLDVEIGS